MQGAMTSKIVVPPGIEFLKHYHIIKNYNTLLGKSILTHIFILQKYCDMIVLYSAEQFHNVR